MKQKALRQFTIKRLREPVDKQLDEDIEWICSSLGFLSSRDQDKTAYRILKALIESAKDGIGMTSEELTQFVEPTIGSVHYHLKKLMKAGLVVKLGSVYELRMNSLRKTIEEIERDIRRTLVDIKRVAHDIDDQVGLENRQPAVRI
jgi:DNA-binding transcriptional ArsR family regulator